MKKTSLYLIVLFMFCFIFKASQVFAGIDMKYCYLPMPIDVNGKSYPSPFYLYAKCAEINKPLIDFSAPEYALTVEGFVSQVVSIIRNNDLKAFNDLLLPGEKDNEKFVSTIMKAIRNTWLSDDIMVLWRIDINKDSYVTIYSKPKDFYYHFVVTELSEGHYGLILHVNDPLYQIVAFMKQYKQLLKEDNFIPKFSISIPYKGEISDKNDVKLAFNYALVDCKIDDNGSSKSFPDELGPLKNFITQFFTEINNTSEPANLLRFFDIDFQEMFSQQMQTGKDIESIKRDMKGVVQKKIFKSAVISDSMYYLFYQNEVKAITTTYELDGLIFWKDKQGFIIQDKMVLNRVENLFLNPEIKSQLSKIFNMPSNTMIQQ